MNAELKIVSPLYGGMGLARSEGIYFVKGGIPGELVSVRILDRKKDYSVAEATEILMPSPFRQQPPCPVFGACGGCHYQHITHDYQIIMKQEIVCDCMKRIGKFEDIPFEEAVAGAPFGYRRRAQFKLHDGTLGFYREHTHEVVAFDSCLLLCDELNAVYRKLKSLPLPRGISSITITAGDGISAHIGGPARDRKFLDALLEHCGIDGVVTEEGMSLGEVHSAFTASPLTYAVSPQSFFQSNWDMNVRLAELLAASVEAMHGRSGSPRPRGRLLEIYGGAGNFSLYLSELFKTVVVVEENPHSVSDGKRNALANAKTNISFHNSLFEDYPVRGNFDVAIADPPRAGLSNTAVRKLLTLRPGAIYYISCNPATLSRDAGKLREHYDLASIRLVDMFPQTYHCEILCHFLLK